MSVSSNSQQNECSICGSVRDSVKLLPCSHDRICLICTRKLLEPRCPFCRSAITSVQIAEGEESYEDLRAEYIANEKRDLKKTVQLSLVGPHFQHNQSVLDLLLKHSRHNSDDELKQTKYSPNCSYHGLNSRISFQQLPQTNGFSTNTDRFEAHAVAIIVNGFDENTLKKFHDWHLKVLRLSSAPIVWILKHDVDWISVCFGENLEELLRQNSDARRSSYIFKLFIPVVKGNGSTECTKHNTERLYEFLWEIGNFHKVSQYLMAMYGGT